MVPEANSGLSDGVIRLRTLGSVDLRAANGAQIHSVLRQPKRLALLIYLALNEPVFHRRDRLLPVFWPESDEERARGSLSQYVFQLRNALGKDVIVSRGDDEVGLATNLLWCDAAVFDDHIRNARYAQAMELYTGELLPGFNVDDAPEFERWLDEERRRRSEQAADAAIALSDQAAGRGELRSGLDWARRAIAIQPLGEPAHQRLITLLDESGDRAAALAAFDELSHRLKQEFDAEPSAETLELIRSVRERAQPKARRLATLGSFEPAATGPKKRRSAAPYAVAGIAVVLVLAMVWSALSRRAPRVAVSPANHVAVLYFSDESANRDLAYLAEGLTSTLIDQLGQVKQLQVISRNGVRPFLGSHVPLDSIARQLDVGTLVGGSVTKSNERLRVTVELINGATGVVMQTKRLERPDGELFALLDDISREVASFLRTSVGQEIKVRQWQSETRNVDAWRALQEAEVLRLAADEDENSGRLTEAEMTLARADSLATRASSLDRHLADAQVMRGQIAERRAWIAFMGGKQDSVAYWLESAARYAERALDVKAHDAAAYELRGSSSYMRYLLLPAPSKDSLLQASETDLRESLRLSSGRPRAESRLSLVLYSQGNFLESREAARRALAADAYLTDAKQIVARLFETSFELGDDAEAGRWCDEIRHRFGGEWPSAWCDLVLLAWGSHANPDPRKARHLLADFAPADPEHLRKAMQPRMTMFTAAVLARAGMRDSANAMLSRARAAAPNDIELLPLEAAARLLMNDDQRAVGLLRQYLEANPAAKPRLVRQRFFAKVRQQLS